MSPWFRALLEKLREGEPQVGVLLAEDPFEGQPPARLRINLYQYPFSTDAERRESGRWWDRELVWTAEETPVH